ncbi:MAG: hypothetical protein Q4G04_00345 [bacterium]|nr:hypothetical protein [bacterium]
MNSLSKSIKKFLSNKNTVTILGVIGAIVVLYIGYNWRINAATEPVNIPYANTTIQPTETITIDKISYMPVPASFIQEGILTNVKDITDKVANYNTMIPKGSPFYKEAIIDSKELPNSAFAGIEDGYTVINFPVTLQSTYGNSMYPGDYINLYLKTNDDDNKLVYGKLLNNIKILAVKDSSGRHVFENTDESRTPAYLIIALPEEIHLLVRKALYLSNTSLEPVPQTASEEAANNYTLEVNQELKEFILSRTANISSDMLPEIG